jgi:putative ABC transport system ATP-binding protein
VIRLEGVSRTYLLGHEPVHALVDITEHIEPGEHVAIMGPSGSGKSTLLNVLGCLDRPDQGTYWLNGREVGQLSDDELTDVRRHTIGFVFQSFHLVPRLTAAENVELPMLFARGSRAPSAGSGLRRLSERSASRTGPATGRTSSPAASASAWPSPAPRSWTPACSSPTSPPATSTPPRAGRSSTSSTA